MGGKAALILVMGFSFVLGYIALNLNRIATKAVGSMSTYVDMTASNTLAKTGVNVGLAKFYQDTTWRGSITQTFAGPALKGSFTASTVNAPNNTVRLRSVSTYSAFTGDSMHDTVEVFFNRNRSQSFSLFTWMTNTENGVSWIAGDTVWGRVHSNNTLTINGKPVFYEKVTTSKSFSTRPGKNPNNAIFKKGYETGVATIDLPTDLTDLISASAGGRRYTQNPIWVTLDKGTSANGDGKAFVRTTKTGPIIDSINMNDPAFSGVILGNGIVNISGTLDGRLTVASLTDMYIQDDVVYQDNPRFTNSDDMLGLVAESDVIVAENTANNSSVEIHGSIFTRTGSFSAQDYSLLSPRGDLKVLGSIVQKTRGPVGTFSGSTLKSGYYKRYRYDERLADPNVRPPFYPGYYIKTLAISNWWESYRIADFTRD